jgi:hypothetical protein
MRTRPATVTILLLAGLAAACSAAGPGTTAPSGETAAAGPRSQPPVVHVAGHGLPTPPPGADAEAAHPGRGAPGARTSRATPTEVADVADPAAIDDPADAAAGLVTDLLAAEGLTVTSIDTDLERHQDDQAQVRVDVAHSPGHGHPVQSRYLLELVRDAGRWRLVRFSELG